MRIALIADTNLSARSPECVANWHAARRTVGRLEAVGINAQLLGSDSAQEGALWAWIARRAGHAPDHAASACST